jgi:hypothetical protein
MSLSLAPTNTQSSAWLVRKQQIARRTWIDAFRLFDQGHDVIAPYTKSHRDLP